MYKTEFFKPQVNLVRHHPNMYMEGLAMALIWMMTYM